MRGIKIITFFLIIISNSTIAQIQLGQSLYGESGGDTFGNSVSINGDGTIIAVGAVHSNKGGYESGIVKVYGYRKDEWAQIGNDIFVNDIKKMGYEVCLNSKGNIVAIGAPTSNRQNGAVCVFKNIDGKWVHVGNEIIGDTLATHNGRSISLNSEGNIIAIGAKIFTDGYTANGLVRTFKFENDKWIQIGKTIESSQSDDNFGASVCLNSLGNILAIGANKSNYNKGHVSIFKLESNNWIKYGENIIGESNGDMFGNAISLDSSGDIIAVGAPYNHGNSIESGHVRVFIKTSIDWQQIGSDINGDFKSDYFGGSVSLNSVGSIVCVGAKFYDKNGDNSGLVRIFKFQNESWIPYGGDIMGEQPKDLLGNSVGLSSDGKEIVIGAYWNKKNGMYTGQVKVFKLDVE
jgi:hypothetical protein